MRIWNMFGLLPAFRLFVPMSLARRRHTDGSRCKVDDSSEKVTVLSALLRAEERVGMPEKRGVDRSPIRVGQVSGRQRQQLIFFDPHVLPVKRRKVRG